MTAYWLPRARELEAAGLSLGAIDAAVGRSKVAVWRQLRGARSDQTSAPRPGRARDPEAERRSRIRAMARAEAAETGEDVAAIYARWGVTALDRSRLWDERRGA